MTKKVLKPLNQIDMFVADILDISPKSDMTSMEHPIFSLSKKPDTAKFRYDHPTLDAWLEVVPSSDGRATIFDKDLLLYCYGQVVEGFNRGKNVSRRLHITPHDYFVSTGKSTGGKQYKDLLASVARLRGTTIKTNIVSGDKNAQRAEVFGLIDGARIVEEGGRAIALEITLSERIFKAISNKQVLTYSKDYFSLTSGFDRRMYELARKHCGNQSDWTIKLENLYNKFGSRSSMREFRRQIKAMEQRQSLPEYFIQYIKMGKVEKVVIDNDKEGYMKVVPRETPH